MISRRSFLRTVSASATGILMAERILADPYRPLPLITDGFRPIRIRGRVHCGTRGIKDAVVSDGRSVAATGADGRFELLSDSSRLFVFLSIPAGFAIPTGSTGTATFSLPIVPDSSGEMTACWELKRVEESAPDHTFLVLADLHTCHESDFSWFRAETVCGVQRIVKNISGDVFGVSCGDIMDDQPEFFPLYEKEVRNMGIPFFQVIGNRDGDSLGPTGEKSSLTFMRHFGPTYYSFNRGSIHYVVLDDILWYGEDYLGYVGKVQLEWLQKDLSFIEKGRTVVVFMHIPSVSTGNKRERTGIPDSRMTVSNREAIYRLLEPYRAHIIAGHMHETEHFVDQGVDIHVLGAVCGAWWRSSHCDDGTPRGYSVFDVRGDELRWTSKSDYKMLWNQMTQFSPESINHNSREMIIANISDSDESWKVFWFENGEPRGGMRRSGGIAHRLTTSSQMRPVPRRFRTCGPCVTNHLYQGELRSRDSVIVIEAFDRWGRIFHGSTRVSVPKSRHDFNPN